MDIQSQALSRPLLKNESAASEVNAVNSEFQNGLSSEGRRSREVLIDNMDDGHPAKHFSCGNIKTLTHPNMAKEVRRFFKN